VTKTSFHSNSFVLLLSLKAREPDSCYKPQKEQEQKFQKAAKVCMGGLFKKVGPKMALVKKKS
jgi:hypothetical protein